MYDREGQGQAVQAGDALVKLRTPEGDVVKLCRPAGGKENVEEGGGGKAPLVQLILS